MTSIDGYVPLASYDEEGRSKQSGHTAAYKLLREAIEDGVVDGFQHGGSKRWLVHKQQADNFLQQEARYRRDREPKAESSSDDDRHLTCLIVIADTLSKILDVLRGRADEGEVVS